MENGLSKPESVQLVSIQRFRDDRSETLIDRVAVEDALEIRLTSDQGTGVVAITMRTPGDDIHLAIGYLQTEGILRDPGQIAKCDMEEEHAVRITLRPRMQIDLSSLTRSSFVSSACGACGKKSREALRGTATYKINSAHPPFSPSVIHALPERLRSAQDVFRVTGGIHAAGLFNTSGSLLAIAEDVGRHNAVDKLVGSQFLKGNLPLREEILFLSGRAGFELIQKASVAGIPIIAAVGAPSTYAVRLAEEVGITLMGFVRKNHFNVYTSHGTIIEPSNHSGAPAGTV